MNPLLGHPIRPITSNADLAAVVGVVVAGLAILAIVGWLQRPGRRRK